MLTRAQVSGVSGGCVVADAMGLGKTLEALCMAAILAAVDRDGAAVALAVVPLNVISSWCKEVRRHFDTRLRTLVVGKYHMNQPSPAEIMSQDIILVTHNTLQQIWHNELKPAYKCYAIDPSTKHFGLQFENHIPKAMYGSYHPLLLTHFAMVLVDEAHKMRSRTTELFCACMALHSTRLRVAMTGTPIINSINDRLALCDFCGFEPNQYESNTVAAKKESCPAVESVSSSSNTAETEQIPYIAAFGQVPAAYMHEVQVKAGSALRALIEHLRSVSTIYNSSGIAEDQLHRQAAENLYNPTDKLRAACPPNLLRAAQQEQHPKETQVLQIVKEARAEQRRTLIFCSFKGSVQGIARLFGGRAIAISGDTNKYERQAAAQPFCSKSNVDVLVCTQMLGTGVNYLTEASVVILMSPWWNREQDLQCIARVHRLGQRLTVHVYALCMDDSVDKRIVEAAERKHQMIEQHVDS
jgi:SNF2 family DNA or RNA helicase